MSLGFSEIVAPIFASSFLQEKRAMSEHSPMISNLNAFISISIQINYLTTQNRRNYCILQHKILHFENQATAYPLI